MRTIKFRAWDTKYNQMVLWDDISKTNIIGSLINNNNRNISHGILMQFTGLLDKNGIEIYDGDILRTKNKKVQEVIFMNGFFQMPEFFIDETDEIIGNIFQHPHLLEANHD